jgi:glycosyltransferase involved in cell wall biosynthesis
LKILFTQHVGVLGGSSRSLLELISNLPNEIDVSVLCPKGKYSELLKKRGINVHSIIGMPQFNNTMISHYKGIRWLILLREIFYLPFLFLKLLQLRKEKYDIVHINEITQVYILILSKILLRTKTIMHVRVMMCTKKNFRYNFLLNIFKKYSDQIIAIDESVNSTLDKSLNVKVVHNGMSLKNINITKHKRKVFTVGIVANFQRYKGILEFLDAANICINKKKIDVNFFVFGAEYVNTQSLKEKIFQGFGFHENIEAIIKKKINKYSFGDRLKLKGYKHHSDDIYNNIDLLTFPSHLNAVGRPVFEAGFYGIPSIVAVEDEFDDTIINNVTGICIKEKDSLSLANAIEKLYLDANLLISMGLESYKLAKTLYNSRINSLEIYEIYKNLLRKSKKYL